MAYTVPEVADLKLRYPAFASVEDATVDYWLADAQRVVKTSWIEDDYAPAMLALAAHNMASLGLGPNGDAVANLAEMGVTDFKSAAMAVSFDASKVKAKVKGGYGSTPYGLEFSEYLRRNRGGVRVVTGSRCYL